MDGNLVGAVQYAGYVDLAQGTIGRRIFVDDAVYRTELAKIFARCWLYLAHESQIPNPGDFVSVIMGEDPVILCRDPDHKIVAFLNSCRHRGNKVCRADQGNARSFVCSYHGWGYDTRGRLIGVPGLKEFYKEQLDRAAWGLVPVAQIGSYKGLIFATFDPAAPPLDDYLGDMRWGLDLLLDQGDLVAVPGVARWQMEGNWKFAADNAIGDMYHGGWTHRSAIIAGHMLGTGDKPTALGAAMVGPGFTLVTEYGHGLNANFLEEDRVDWGSGLADWRKDAGIVHRMGPLRAKVNRANMNVFPNLFVNSGSRELMLRNPKGPTGMEIWKTVLVDRNASPEVRRAQVRSSNRHFGPAGMFEQDDGENWDQSTIGARGLVAQGHDLHYAMGIGRGQFVTRDGSPPLIESLVNEHCQLWFYRCWAEFMDAPDWPELKRHHARPEGRL